MWEMLQRCGEPSLNIYIGKTQAFLHTGTYKHTGIHNEPVPNPKCFSMLYLKEEEKEKINLAFLLK